MATSIANGSRYENVKYHSGNNDGRLFLNGALRETLPSNAGAINGPTKRRVHSDPQHNSQLKLNARAKDGLKWRAIDKRLKLEELSTPLNMEYITVY
ncbi:hypothetical protein BELL_0187g00150 [Botrytis elliptica]|uniref:Uncharacterized protein n=1 Tax=Botrytis elliptica TaxID=278938 RepID=A0A4Z1JQ39_9HELO|nr:hypothetical protein BELL_0187g00150 [Botrytis elliptica]